MVSVSLLLLCGVVAAQQRVLYRAFSAIGDVEPVDGALTGSAADFTRVYHNSSGYYQRLFPFYRDPATNQLVLRSSITDLPGDPDATRYWTALGLHPQQHTNSTLDGARWSRLCSVVCFAHNASYTIEYEAQLQAFTTLAGSPVSGAGLHVFTFAALGDREGLPSGVAADFRSGLALADYTNYSNNGAPSVNAYYLRKTPCFDAALSDGFFPDCTQLNLTGEAPMQRATDGSLLLPEWLRIRLDVRGGANGFLSYTFNVWRDDGTRNVFNATFIANTSAFIATPGALGTGFGGGIGYMRVRRLAIMSDVAEELPTIPSTTTFSPTLSSTVSTLSTSISLRSTTTALPSPGERDSNATSVIAAVVLVSLYLLAAAVALVAYRRFKRRVTPPEATNDVEMAPRRRQGSRSAHTPRAPNVTSVDTDVARDDYIDLVVVPLYDNTDTALAAAPAPSPYDSTNAKLHEDEDAFGADPADFIVRDIMQGRAALDARDYAAMALRRRSAV